MSRISRTRVKRTRPSLAWPTILIDNVDFVSSYKDFQPNAESSVFVPNKKKQKKPRKRKKAIPAPLTPENAEEIKRINAFFDDVDDYEFVIEEVKEDKWVMDASTSSTNNAAASDFFSDVSVWTNNRTPDRRKSTTGFIGKITDFTEDDNISSYSSSRLSDEPKIAKQKSVDEENDKDEKQSEESEAAAAVGNDLHYLLQACGQRTVRSWEDFCFSSRKCKKLGEGTYGEVYKTDIRDRPVALKVVPFVCDEISSSRLVNGERMKSAMEILPELLITADLSALSGERNGQQTSGFVCLVQAAVVQGEYPETLLSEWDKFAKVKETLNDRPDKYSTPAQLFITFALSLGGKDLEAYTIRSEKECFSILFQIAFSLAVAEEVLQFEHRDLHVGNVLIDQCKAGEQIRCVLNGEEVILRSCGVKAAIIDFTNSRMQRDNTIIYLDLSKDEELFTGEGDYQFEIYRMMRKNNNNDWKSFHPYTNLLWLHYLAMKLFATKKITPKRRREVMKEMDRMLNFERIKQFLADKVIAAFLADYVT